MGEQNADYREHLVLAEQKGQEYYDKAILSLSGGGLGISLVFIEKVIGAAKPVLLWALLSAWLCWGASIAAVLASYFLSHKALRKAIKQCDETPGPLPEQPGGAFATATEVFNIVSGALFVIGVILIALFTISNLGAKYV